MVSRDLLKEYWNDPLYRAVMAAKTKDALESAIDTLKAIRGSHAYKHLQEAREQYRLDIENSRCKFCGAGDDNHHSFSCKNKV